MMMMMMIVQ